MFAFVKRFPAVPAAMCERLFTVLLLLYSIDTGYEKGMGPSFRKKTRKTCEKSGYFVKPQGEILQSSFQELLRKQKTSEVQIFGGHDFGMVGDDRIELPTSCL